MTTPNNKSWEEEFDEVVHYEDGLYNTESGWRVTADPKKIKQFISSLLEQERKDERQRVLSEVRKINDWECGEDYPNSEDCYCESGRSIRLEDYINQLKEE